MQPDVIWHYKHLPKQVYHDLTQHASVQASGYDAGADISGWQGSVDFAKLKSKVSYVYIRAGYGNDYVDPRCDEYRAGCAAVGLPFGLYWFAVPGKDWNKHAKNFYTKWHQSPGSLPPCFDLEVSGGLAKTELESWLQKMYMHPTYGFTTLAGLSLEDMLTYTSPGFCNRAIGKTNWLKRTQLWVAHWTTAAQPTIPDEWADIANPKTWTNWQYSSTGNGSDYGVSSHYIDLDWGKFGIAPPPPPPIGDDMKMRVTADVLNVREGPGTTYADVGDLHSGDVVDMLNVGGTSAWVQIRGGQYDGKWICVQLAAQRYCEPVE